MVQINLLPWKEQERQVELVIFSLKLLVSALAALFCVFLCHVYFDQVIHYRQKRNDFLQAELNQTQVELAALEKQQEQETALLDKMHFIINLRNQNYKIVRLLDALAVLTSPTVSLTKIIRDKDNITLEGVAQSDIEITLFMKNLARSSIFDEPVLTGIGPKKTGEIIQRFFQLKLTQRE